ncbi:hypothetical protein BDB01DRAFT_831669 [Pilobolus umbonatus]|nr:hypothetical protein BDB01DRAFT_831669 [Pilobolus umbonatus]
MTINHTSVYDNIPSLDSWYKQSQREVVTNDTTANNTDPVAKKRKNSGVNVSFSTHPPCIYRYDTTGYKSKKSSLHRRDGSADSVKDFIKHYTSKISKRLH